MERKIILENIEVEGIRSLEVYRKKGGYKSVEKALKKMTPDEVVNEVKTSGLRGRGGAGFPNGHEMELYRQEKRQSALPSFATVMRASPALLKTVIC